MARLSGKLRDWLARVEILARGAEQHRVEAVRALGASQPAVARSHALAILDGLPRSRVALALWADAAEAMMLDEERREALERLAREVPFRSDIWYRLAQARHRCGAADVGEPLQRAVEAEEPPEFADAALLWLAERDLAAGDPARAERWLERVSLGGRQLPQVRRCLAEARLDLDDFDGAVQAARGLDAPLVADGRGWLLQGRLLARSNPDRAAAAFERALLLRTPGATRVVSAFIERGTAHLAQRFRPVVESLGHGDEPRWRAAFAVAAGREAEAVEALAAAARDDPDPELLRGYSVAAVDARIPAAVVEAAELAGRREVSLDVAVDALARAFRAGSVVERLAALDEVPSGKAAAWASALRREAYADWLPSAGSAWWREVLAEIDDVARQLGELAVVGQTEALARELQHPLRVAVVGEFNAGKSSFINALLGEEVAPVGVLPTTATVNRLSWAPDRFARIVRRDGERDRVVAHADLRRTLREVGAAEVEEVVIYAPLEPLRRVEVVDTPGFNASEPAHGHTARAAFGEAHVALWLLDATQPLKDTEREILREMVGLAVPLVVLVNKSDRLEAEPARRRVLEYVRDGLDAVGIPVENPPIAFSARLAIAGQRGDAAALAASGWRAVESLVERLLVSQSVALRERALRRRAGGIASQLADVARERAAARAAESRRAAEARRGALALAARVRASRGDLEKVLEAAATAGLTEFGRDVQPVLGAVDAGERFVTSRARSTVGRRVGVAALEYCEARLGEVPAEHRARYLVRVESAAAIVAPWLIEEVMSRPRGGEAAALGDDAGPRWSASARVARAALDELAATAEEAALEVSEPAPDPAGARIIDLAGMLTVTFES